MKHKIIRINDVSEIDTSSITVYDMNNRYIDNAGKMYGLRYNKFKKKIEIINLIRTHSKDAPQIQKEILKKRINEQNIDREEAGNAPGGEIEVENMGDRLDNFAPSNFIKEAVATMITHKSRLSGIIMNVKNSNIVPKDSKTENSELEDIFRNIEIDGIQAIENIENYEKELVNYPRSITYYQAKIDRRGTEIIDRLNMSKQKIMEFIYLYEMHQSLKGLYKNLNDLINRLYEFIDSKDPEENRHMSSMEKQALNDAKVSIKNTIADVEKILDDLLVLEEYIYDPENF